MPPKSEQVFGVHVTHVSPWQTSPTPQGAHDFWMPQWRFTDPQPVTSPPSAASSHESGVQHESPMHTPSFTHGAQDCCTPQLRSTGAQPVTRPASMAAAQLLGVQQLPLSHVSFAPHDPHETAGPHPFATCPHVAAPHVGAVHAVHTPALQAVAPVHPPHFTVPLPQAFITVPHADPAPPSPVHSGGGGPHTPPLHSWPLGHVQAIACPHPLVTVPQSATPALGVHVTFPQVPPPASVGGGGVTHALWMHTWPPVHPPHEIGTPHGSSPMSPHLPVHDGAWQLCVLPLATHDSPLPHGLPHVSVAPVQST